jgi:hypothetical protein
MPPIILPKVSCSLMFWICQLGSGHLLRVAMIGEACFELADEGLGTKKSTDAKKGRCDTG